VGRVVTLVLQAPEYAVLPEYAVRAWPASRTRAARDARVGAGDRFGPRPQRAWLVRSSVRPEAGRRQPQRDSRVQRVLEPERGDQAQIGGMPWTHTGMRIGMRPASQMKSMAGTDTRTQPCEAG
jgi:hypothetical protein